MNKPTPRLSLASSLLAAAALALPLAALPAAADDDLVKYKLKPGAKGKACLSCHTDFADAVKRPFIHTPVKNGECSDCHDPHAASHGKLLAESPAKICSTCHADVVPSEARSVHRQVLEGACTKCHDPHASQHKGQTLQAGNELCASCHGELGKAALAAKYKHPPVTRSCLTCHDPHSGAKTPALLRKAAAELCAECHKPDAPNFKKAHLDYPVQKADCGSCHDPHGSDQPAILWASVHQPVRNRMCAQCHNAPGTPDALAPKRTGIDGCKSCHSDTVNAALAKNRLHWPLVDRAACVNCHEPHAAKTRKLLRADEKALCGTCHADAVRRQDRALVKHPPIAEGNCSACHGAHGGDQLFLLAGNSTTDTCGNCHDWGKHSMHPAGPKVTDPRNPNLSLDCTSCHRTHGTPFKNMAHLDTRKDLCTQCHSDRGR